MPYKSKAQAAFMHAKLPKIAKRWDAEAREAPKTYRTGSPVAHKGMKLDPTGYVNREVNKGKRSQKRSGLAQKMLQNAANRRLSAMKGRPQPRKGA